MNLNDHALAELIARRAGDVLNVLRRLAGEVSPDCLRDCGDSTSQALIASLLRGTRPEDAILSEEAAEDGRRLSSSRVWIVDPLDGTREFGEPDRTDWAVHVALIVDHRPQAGAIALPGSGEMFSTASPPPLPGRPQAPVRILVSRTRPPAFADRLAQEMGAVLIPMGSAGAKVAAILRGEADAYIHAGGQFEWDSAAPVAVAQAASLHTSRLDGSPLLYNQGRPWLPDQLVCRRELASEILSRLSQTLSGS